MTTPLPDAADYKWDLLSLGEVMLRLSPPRYERLRRPTSLDLHVAGSQLNVAACLAGLGLSTAFVTNLPENDLGRFVLETCRGYGVDMHHVRMIPESRIGLNFVELNAGPSSTVIYDREASAAASMRTGDFDWDILLGGSRAVYTDGILLGLSDACRETGIEFLRSAAQMGSTTCFDANYRHHIWGSPDAARKVWRTALNHVDVLVTNRMVSEEVFGFRGTDEELVSRYRDEFGCQTVALTSRTMSGTRKGRWNACALQGTDFVEATPVSFEVADRYGTGDAWFAGFLFAHLRGAGLIEALKLAGALCAFSHGYEGDIVQLTRADLDRLLSPASYGSPVR